MAPPVPRPAEEVKRPRTDADRFKLAGITASRESLTRVPAKVLTLIRDKTHSLYDPRVDDPVDPALVNDDKYKALVANIAANGVQQAIIVRRNGTRTEIVEGKEVEVPILQVVDGRQRTQITLWLDETQPLPDSKLRTVPIKYEDGDDGEMVLISLAHKLGRDEQPFSRAWKIRAAKKLGRNDEEISQACGWSPRTGTVAIKEHLAILSMIDEVQKAFNGELPASCIKIFMTVPREEQLAALEKVRAVRASNGEGGISTAEVKAAVKSSRTGVAYQPPKKIRPIDPEWLHRVKDALEKQVPAFTQQNAALSNDNNVQRTLGQMEGALAFLRYLCGDGLALQNHAHLLTAVATATAPSQAA
jgi:hypothetical protein